MIVRSRVVVLDSCQDFWFLVVMIDIKLGSRCIDVYHVLVLKDLVNHVLRTSLMFVYETMDNALICIVEDERKVLTLSLIHI